MNKKIIIAEDSAIIQKLIKKILLEINYHVTLVKNGKEVLELLEKDKYDLILLDIYMPKMDGMECTRNIRKMSGENQSIPLIAITGNAKNYSQKYFEDVGINECIYKPLNYDKLVKTVNNYLKEA